MLAEFMLIMTLSRASVWRFPSFKLHKVPATTVSDGLRSAHFHEFVRFPAFGSER